MPRICLVAVMLAAACDGSIDGPNPGASASNPNPDASSNRPVDGAGGNPDAAISPDAATQPDAPPAGPRHARCGWIGPGDSSGVQTFVANATYFDVVHPAWYAINSDGITVRA